MGAELEANEPAPWPTFSPLIIYFALAGCFAIGGGLLLASGPSRLPNAPDTFDHTLAGAIGYLLGCLMAAFIPGFFIGAAAKTMRRYFIGVFVATALFAAFNLKMIWALPFSLMLWGLLFAWFFHVKIPQWREEQAPPQN